MKNKLLSIIIVGLLFALPVSAALVQCGNADASECKIGDLLTLVIRIINQLLAWSGLVAVFFILWAGFGMINATGDSEKIQEAKTTLSNAIVGFMLVLVAYVLVNTVSLMFTGYGFRDILRFLP